ncbi:MAG: hypothetical protein M3N50_10010 [Pseudomonadota bacterium]|nr:hypothetical protein [Pseudomonadota bacterium]
MSERGQSMDDAMKFGLLMESAHAHQTLAETHLERLRAHTQELDVVVRDEIRRTLISELRLLNLETKRTTESLQRLRRGAGLRAGICSILLAVLCTCIPLAITYWTLPSESDVATLRARRDALAAAVAVLERRGGRVEWRHCGNAARLCVRIDHSAPAYGDRSDFYVVAGY